MWNQSIIFFWLNQPKKRKVCLEGSFQIWQSARNGDTKTISISSYLVELPDTPFFFLSVFPPPRSQFPSAIQLVSCFSLITRENTPKPQRVIESLPQHSCSFSKHASGSGFWQKVFFPEVGFSPHIRRKTTQIIHILFKAPCNLSNVIIIYQLLLRAFVWSL